MDSKVTIVLSDEELTYLTAGAWLPISLATVLRSADVRTGDRHRLSMSRGEAEVLRSTFTERLAAIGFDTEYAVNDEGRMLEDLIDRFYVP